MKEPTSQERASAAARAESEAKKNGTPSSTSGSPKGSRGFGDYGTELTVQQRVLATIEAEKERIERERNIGHERGMGGRGR